MDRALRDAVRRRARDRCEYCRIPQAYYPERFQIDHVIAEKHAGPTVFGNLALCCLECNLSKGPNVAGVDPQSGNIIPLYNPRHETWSEHFQMDRGVIVALTPTGRATIAVLNLNRAPRVAVRRALFEEGVMGEVQ
jgi:hypothetical protein